MPDQFSRTRMLLGEAALERLFRARVAVFGVGGVGSYAAEALVRGGVGALDLIDDDRVCLTNLNRQLFATHKTVGQYKVDAARERLLDVNPGAVIRTCRTFYLPATADRFDFTQYDYIIDAIDTVAAKLSLVLEAQRVGTPILSSMGTGNKLDPGALRIGDIYSTSVCPLARVMRKELRRRGVPSLKVLYSTETPLSPTGDETEDARPGSARRQIPGSVSFVPPAAGLMIAGEVIRDLTGVRSAP